MEIKEKLEHWKLLADDLLREDKKAIIKDIYDNLYFGDILIVGETTITIFCTGPKQRANKNETLYWANISYFDKAMGEGTC